ncbi:hypothetical protein NW765_016348 [Fusarium oxysporum]|nr:hypothetical protein NW765_016348 [Fusarium oxysporum]
MPMALEGIGIAANIIAVVDLSAKVIGWCARYAQDVKNAKEDKARLSREVTRLHLELQNARDLLNGTQSLRLKASHAVFLATADSESQLRYLEKSLAFSQQSGKMRLDALKRPFQSKEVDVIAQALRRCTEAIHSALQVDQTSIILGIDQRTALDRIPIAWGASFDSHAEEHNPTCLPNTRVELLDLISRWIDDPEARTIFWLNGMAGTGKSTISRTIARSRSQLGDLGASFFFKRGETDRGHLAKFFPTIACQLAESVPALATHIQDVIDADSAIVGKALREQFDKLIWGPLSRMLLTSRSLLPLVFVIDALDECEQDADIRLLIDLLSRTQSPQLPRLRIFITSRPELAIRLGFSNVKGTYQDFILHEIPASIVRHDIRVYLEHELGIIRHTFNLYAEEQKLPSDWPGEFKLQRLVTMVVPLFIFASTVCRFIGDWKCGNPNKQLQIVLRHMNENHGSKLGMTYSPALKQQLTDRTRREKEEIVKEFRLIVGSIVCLASPLSTRALAVMLEVPLDTLADRLRMLHSVLSVPATHDLPVRLLHLSFRDYIADPGTKEINEFWVDEDLMHQDLAKQCLHIMRNTLGENICSVRSPGTHRSNINAQQIDACLSSELKYACLYWMHHRAANGQDQNLSSFMTDAVRFVQMNFSVIDEAPLQIYSSALVFAPTKSVVRTTFNTRIPKWISRWPQVKGSWDACLSILEGHYDSIETVVFSHDSKLVASGSADETVRIWSVKTGKCERVLKGHSSFVTSIVFSHNSKLVAFASYDETVRIWHVETGKCDRVIHLGRGSRQLYFEAGDTRLVTDAGVY